MGDIITCRPPKSVDEVDAALALRQQVFIVEEGRDRFVDADEIDLTAQHIVAVSADEVIGTLRLYHLNLGDADIKIGRVAVRKDRRGQGIGAGLMNAAHEWAGARYPSIYLHAQIQVRGFYEKLGYIAEGEIFNEAGTPHILMRRKIP